MISDLDGSLGSREFLNVANEILGVDQKERGLWGREWDMFCIVRVRIWKFRVDHLFGMHFWLKKLPMFLPRLNDYQWRLRKDSSSIGIILK